MASCAFDCLLPIVLCGKRNRAQRSLWSHKKTRLTPRKKVRLPIGLTTRTLRVVAGIRGPGDFAGAFIYKYALDARRPNLLAFLRDKEVEHRHAFCLDRLKRKRLGFTDARQCAARHRHPQKFHAG
ncbi:MAG: hypothetical protein DWI25_05990 [Planctomycetota bacterium]|nr:MAG: hypothetical protein DWI25_05990 [Planctomycetota bacterium]